MACMKLLNTNMYVLKYEWVLVHIIHLVSCIAVYL